MTKEQLQPFCHDKLPRYARPFTEKGWTYAAGGPMAVRVPPLADVPPLETPSNIGGLFPVDLDRRCYVAPPDLPPPQTQPCRKCRGYGHFKMCHACDGEGSKTCHSCGHGYSCEECGGEGGLPAETGTDCRDCHGVGHHPVEQTIEFGGRKYNSELLRKILTLPGVEFGADVIPDSNVPLCFRFAGGGHGLVMGYRF